MAFEITGKLIEKFDIQTVSDKFRKREFVIEYRENPTSSYSEMLKFQLTQDRCTLVDAYTIGQEVKVWFNLRGRRWEKDGSVNYFTNLEAWRMESIAAAAQTSTTGELPDSRQTDTFQDETTNDLPF
jgi:hypothetical protein